MYDESNIQVLSDIIQKAVQECLKGIVIRPQAQRIIDWRQNFIVKDPDTAETIYHIKHHFPFDPKIGETWNISTWNYGGPAPSTEEEIAVEIDQIVYDWRPQRYENNYLYGWFLEIKVFCHLSTEHMDHSLKSKPSN